MGDTVNTTIGELKDSLIVCQTSQGQELRGTLLKCTRFLVVFEIYNPNSILQTSEVLHDFKIIWNGRSLYSGRAVVRNLMNTGLVTLCEATLSDSWAYMDFSSPAALRENLGGQFQEFIQEWQKLYRILPDYKVVLADMQTFLTDLRLWLDQVEIGIRSSPSGDRIQLERDTAEQLGASIVPAVNHLFERFEAISDQIEPDMVPAHRVFGKRQIHSLLLCSPFVYRTFHKPLGYAGDYEMVNMMFRDSFEGGSLFAKMVNAYALQLPPIVAHRNRIAYLTEQLGVETRRIVARNRPLRIYNLGCGPAQEIQRFMANNALSDQTSFTLADFNDETLEHAGSILNDVKRKHGRATQIQMVKNSVHQVLKQSNRTIQSSNGDKYDMIYCAGLFDYLSDNVCRKLMEIFYGMLAPDGLLVATNVDVHPARNEMECFLEWHLIHRNLDQMLTLIPPKATRDNAALKRDVTGVNILLEIRKPTGEK